MDTDTQCSATLNQHNVAQGTTSVPKVDLVRAKVSSEERVKVEQFLSNWQNIFSQSPTDLGCTNLVEHEIKFEDETPFKEPYCRVLPSLIQEVRKHIKEMLEIVRRKMAQFASVLITES